mmetsp:Transcript_12936/g.24636  ORF Transcript_12936/g.24636 Transcript_12936/m.24636 type:complete len:154 (+) Transcript_12936:121-582(+)
MDGSQMQNTAIMDGWMEKFRSTHLVKLWQKRWFRLEGDTLSWYKSPTSECLGSLSLKKLEWTTGPLIAPQELNFRAFQKNKSRQRLFELRAASRKEAEMWRTALSNTMLLVDEEAKSNVHNFRVGRGISMNREGQLSFKALEKSDPERLRSDC